MKKKLTILIAVLVSTVSLWSQAPVNDDCSGLIDLGYAPVCPTDTFTNLNATASNIGFDNNPTCFNGGLASHDVWFMFTCPDTMFDFRITVTGVGLNGMVNPEFAVYRGDCTTDGLAELLCAIADVGENVVYLDVQGLTPGLPYFIRISDFSVTAAPNWGDFTLCVAGIPPSNNVDDGGSTLCSGVLYDSGGPDGDYSPDEDNTFVICPNQPSACITFTLQYYNIEQGGFLGGLDILSFYDGDDINSPLLAQISGDGFDPNAVAGGGGVCFQVQATSGCLTVHFQSDGSTEFEGFQGAWECSSQPCPAPATMTVNSAISAQDIVDAVATPATTVTITDINCPAGAYGTFSFPTDDNQLGLEKGLILTSGQADLAIGPNFLGSTGQSNQGAGDADLDYLSNQQGNGQASHDACIVELDVFVATDQLTFEYVFGSDEYPEYVNSSFNDIFAFLVSGPGITGDPGLGGAENIAIIPGSNVPVQINSVNNLLNWEFYRNNEISQVLEYDGLTSDFLGVKKSLTAQVDVVPCNTYHLKLAVADRGDFVFDSGVFVSEIQGGTPDIQVQFASGIDYFIEDCSGNQDQLVISLSEPAEDLTSFFVTVGGTATQGVDYILNIPAVITFQPGQQQVSFPIFPIADNMPEGTETIVISLSNNFGCGTVVYKTINVNIEDNVLVQVNAGADTLFVCAGNSLQLHAAGATDFFWAPPGAVSNPFIGNPTITPTQDLWLSVTGTVGTCSDVDSVFVRIISPTIDVSANGPVNICQGTSVQLNASNNVSNSGLVWTPAAGLDNPNSPNPVATPTVSTLYKATVSIAGCSVSDQIQINVDTLFFPTLSFEDTTVCQNYPVQLANVLNSTTEYQWTPAGSLSDATSSGPLALPPAGLTVYTLTASSSHAYCTQTASVSVNVIAADIDVLGDTYKEICLGDTVNLIAQVQPSGAVVQWSPAFYVSNPTGISTVASPDESVTLFATYNVNGCVVRDSVHFRVDSLPLSLIQRYEDKPVYCPGDTVYLISKTYEPASFPDIMHAWEPFGEQLTPLDNWNMVVIASETHIYQRITTNRGCVDTALVEVPVAEPPTILISANPSSVCPGEPVQITATVEPSQPLEWEANPTLSCTDCNNPIATPVVTTSYNVSASEAACPAGASITVEVVAPPNLQLAPNQTLCLGESVLLNTANQAGVTYSWTSDPAGFVSNEPTPTVTPTQTTTYKVKAQNSSCDSEGEVVITVVSATLDAGIDQQICVGQTATLTANVSGAQQGVFLWEPGNLITSTVNVTPAASTQYKVTYSYGDHCQTTDSVLVAVLAAPVLDMADNTSFCKGGSLQLNTVSEPGVTYSWTSEPAGFTSSSATPTVTPAQTTTYTVVASNPLCQTTGTVTVTVSDATLELGADKVICFGTSVTLDAATTGTPGTVTWQPGGQIGTSFTVQPDVTTEYFVVLNYGPGCVALDSVTVFVGEPISLSDITVVPDTTALCEGVEITLHVDVTPPEAVLAWSENGTIITGQIDTTIVVVPTTPSGGDAVFTVVATDDNGCTATTEPVSFQITRCILIPNAFTPDGDGVNDTFGLLLKGGEVEITTFQVFNRWGEQVFESTPAQSRWDGKVNGNQAPTDVYLYVMELKFPDGHTEQLKGDVTLIR